MAENNEKQSSYIDCGLASLIPGYAGYRAVNEIVEAGEKIRAYIASGIEELVKSIDVKKLEAASNLSGMAALPSLERAGAALSRIADMLKYAPAGTSSFNFSSSDTSMPLKIKSYDETLYFSFQEAKALVGELAAKNEAAASAALLLKITAWADAYMAKIKARNELLKS